MTAVKHIMYHVLNVRLHAGDKGGDPLGHTEAQELFLFLFLARLTAEGRLEC